MTEPQGDRWAPPPAPAHPRRLLALVPTARWRALPADLRRLARALRTAAAGAWRALLDLVAPLVVVVRSAAALPERVGARGRERALRTAVALVAGRRAGPRRGPSVDRLVTAVIVTRDQPRRLDHLLRALAGLGVPVVVVANAASPATMRLLDLRPLVRTIATPHRNYAAANALGLAEVATPWALLLNDDVEPIGVTWLDELLEAATDDTVAVGAQLVHARRGPLGGAAVDLTVQHDGIGFAATADVPRPVHRGRGALPEVSRDAEDVAAVTGACLLVRMDALRAVGGLDDGFDFGAEDVDLCLRLAGHGRVRVAHRAVLLHREGATRLAGDRARRRARQAANWRRFDGRHAPALRRAVALDRLAGGGTWSTDPFRLRVVGTVDDRVRARWAAVGLTVVGAGDVASGAPVDLVVVRTPTAAPVPTDVAVLDRSRLVPGRGDAAAALVVLDLVVRAGDERAGDASEEAWAASGWFAHADLALVADRGAARRLARIDPTLPCRVVDPEADAAGLAEAVRALVEASVWSLRIGAPDATSAGRWGDGPFAAALARELRALGVVARVTARDGWDRLDATADVVLRLRGRGTSPRREGQRDVLWVMSHPEDVTDAELAAPDAVLAASERLARGLRSRTDVPVHVVPQAADGRTFVTGEVEPALASPVLFVGNSRGILRPIVAAAVAAGLPLSIVGGDWRAFVPWRHLVARRADGAELAARYRSAAVVLSDHWDGMREAGIVANRVFDVLACGGVVVSDDVADVDRLLGRTVVTVAAPDEVAATVRRLLDDPAERRRLGERGARLVRESHLLEHRAAELVRLVGRPAPRTGESAPRRRPAATRSTRSAR